MYGVSRSHPIYKKLRVLYGLPLVESRKCLRSPDPKEDGVVGNPEEDSVVGDDTVPDPEEGLVRDDAVVEDGGKSCSA